MRIDLSSILQRPNKSKTEDIKKQKSSPGQVRHNGSTVYKGQTIKGQVTNISQNYVTIQLEDGELIQGRTQEQMNFLIGENVTFSVESKEGELIILKPIIEGDLSEQRMIDILKNAGLKPTKENLDLLRVLLEKNMPINKQTLTEVSMYTKRFPEAKVEQIVFLMKNDIMISEDALKYSEELLSGKHSVTRNISTFNDDVSQIVEKNAGAKVVRSILHNNEPATTVFTKIRNFFAGQENHVEVPSSKLSFPMTEVMSQNDARLLLDDTSFIAQRAGDEKTLLSMQQFIEEKGTAFSQLFSSVDELDVPQDIKEATNKLLAQRVTQSMLNNELLLQEKDLENLDSINKHYNKVYNRMLDVVNLDIDDTSEAVQKVIKEAVNIKNSVEYMNQLQQNHQFFHIPIMLNEQKVNSELYVMNRKGRKQSKDERITALLRLDLRNLGHLDIYVAKTGNNVEVDFYVEAENIEEDIRNHAMNLHKKLLKESFNVLGISAMIKEKEFEALNDFFEKGDDKSDKKRFTFDMRA